MNDQTTPRSVLIFTGAEPMPRAKLVEALTGLGPRHPAWLAVGQVLRDQMAEWHKTSLDYGNAGQATQTHACGAQAALTDALAELEELMEAAVDVLEGEDQA